MVKAGEPRELVLAEALVHTEFAQPATEPCAHVFRAFCGALTVARGGKVVREDISSEVTVSCLTVGALLLQAYVPDPGLIEVHHRPLWVIASKFEL